MESTLYTHIQFLIAHSMAAESRHKYIITLKVKVLQFNTTSWHFRLVRYVFGESFFVEKRFDVDATVKKIEKEETEFHSKWRNADNTEFHKQYDLFKEKRSGMVYKSIPKVVNLCPYMRAVVSAVILFPFAIIAKRLPKRKQRPFDIKKSRRNTNIIKVVVIVIFAIWGTHNLLQGNYFMAAFQYGAGSFQWWGKYLFEYIAKLAEKREAKKEKDDTPKLPKNPSLFLTYLHTNHNKICPSVAFVDKNDTEVRV